MKALSRPRTSILCAGALLLSAGCAEEGGPVKSETKAGPAAANACSSMAPGEMTQSDYICALGAEIKTIADALATVNDRAGADRAIPILNKSKARIAAVVKERDRLNGQADAGGKAVAASLKLPQLAAANKAFLNEYLRIARAHPELIAVIGPALEGLDIN